MLAVSDRFRRYRFQGKTPSMWTSVCSWLRPEPLKAPVVEAKRLWAFELSAAALRIFYTRSFWNFVAHCMTSLEA